MNADQDSKTEAATPRRREEARNEGRVAYSSELQIGVSLIGLALALRFLGASTLQSCMLSLRASLGSQGISDLSLTEAANATRWTAEGMMATVIPLSGTLWALGLSVGLWQTRALFSTQALTLNWERLSPERGWGRVFSTENAVKVLIAICKLFVAVVIVWRVWSSRASQISEASQGTIRHASTVLAEICDQTLMSLGIWALIVGAIDYGFQWWRHEQSMRMTKGEIKQESRDDQGDPHIRGRLRQMRREMRRRRGLKDIPQATLVITNPTHVAVALVYQPGMAAPRVVAKGTDALARRIKTLAARHSVKTIEHKPLARALYKHAEVGKEIPMQFYQAVAAVLVTIFRERKSQTDAA